MLDNTHSPSQSALRRWSPIVAIVVLCAVGLITGWRGLTHRTSELSLADDPTWPLMFSLRAVGMMLSVWIGGWTLVAVAGRIIGHAATVNVALRVLPGFVSKVVRRSLVVGLTSALLLGNSALAAPSGSEGKSPVSASTPLAASPQPSYSGDVTNGQRWPTASPEERAMIDPDAPSLSVVAGTSVTASTKPDLVGTTSRPSSGVTSLPLTTIVQVTTNSGSTTSPTVGSTEAQLPRSRYARPMTPLKQYTVVGGDHFWSIAERTVLATSMHADESAVHRYWQQLIEHNRPRLKDPNNPDLLVVGSVLELPPVT